MKNWNVLAALGMICLCISSCSEAPLIGSSETSSSAVESAVDSEADDHAVSAAGHDHGAPWSERTPPEEPDLEPTPTLTPDGAGHEGTDTQQPPDPNPGPDLDGPQIDPDAGVGSPYENADPEPEPEASPTLGPVDDRIDTGPPNAGSPMGINVAAVTSRHTAWTFVDLMKMCQVWDPTEQVSLTTDDNGWPILGPGESVDTVMMTSHDHYPAGHYVCLYDGTGDLGFGAADIVEESPGRIVIDVTPSDAGIYLNIKYSDPNDPIRNIRMIMPGFESTYESQVFHPSFLEHLEKFKVVRYLNWLRTNFDITREWSERPTPNDYTQTDFNKGVAIEHMIDLSNRLGADPWFCIPHLASDDYVEQFATLVRDTLDPNLKVYVEYSNEVWNPVFPQHYHAIEQGLARGLSDDDRQAQQRYYAERAVEIFEIWDDVFGSDERLNKVLSTWNSQPWYDRGILDWQVNGFPAHTYATHFAGSMYFHARQIDPGDATTEVSYSIQDVLDICVFNIDNSLRGFTQAHKANADARGLEFIGYEGGQALRGVGPSKYNVSLTTLFTDANRDPGMYDLYQYALSAWQEEGGGLFMAYQSCSPYKPYGNFGLIEYQEQDLAEAHKMRSVLDFIDANSDSPPSAIESGAQSTEITGDQD